MSGVGRFKKFQPAGPVSRDFVRDRTSIVKMILGPVGSGKTVSCIYDGVRRPSIYMPQCNDGVIRYRRAVIGTTYGQLERNLYPSWYRWLPKDPKAWTEGEWVGGGGRFAVQSMKWDVFRRNAKTAKIEQVPIEAEYLFAAVGDMAVEEFMRGLEVTDFYVYEADQHADTLIDTAITRLMRFPATGDADDAVSQEAGASFQPQVAGDTNAPDIDSWFYETFEETRPEGWKLYKQPGGRSPGAENKNNLRAGYYEQQVASLSAKRNGRHLVRRMVDAQYGPSLIGVPVYDEYDDAVHLAPEVLQPLPKLPLVLGFDQGLGQPACVGGQRTPKGQSRMLFECVPGRMSARRFANEVKQAILEYAPGVPLAEVHYCDPAGFDGADKEDGESAWAEIVAAELGIVILPTDTNEIDIRLTAVVDELQHTIEAGMPAFQLSPCMKVTRKGFVSHYMFDKKPDTKAQAKKPIKNLWANPHDALQYWHLGIKGRFGTIQGRRDPAAAERAIGNKRERKAENDDCVHLDAPVQF